MPKNFKGGALWAFLTSNLLQNIEDPLETIKNFRKIAHSAEKNRKGGHFSFVRLCMFCLKWNK